MEDALNSLASHGRKAFSSPKPAPKHVSLGSQKVQYLVIVVLLAVGLCVWGTVSVDVYTQTDIFMCTHTCNHED